MNWKKRYRKLEERVLLDAAGAATVVDAQEPVDSEQQQADYQQEQEDLTNLVAALGETQEDPATGEGEEPTAEILFVDSQVEDVDALLANLSENVEVYFIGPEEDGVAFIADVLSNSGKIFDAIHIISHGDAGELKLGTTTLTQDSLSGDNLENVQAWGDALSEDGDILIYGCSVAEGQTGIDFIEQLAEVTGADIAASVDDTGASASGGDWDLEVTAGDIETEAAIQEDSQRQWGNLLALNVTDRDDLSDADIAEAIAGDASGIGIDSITFSGDNDAIGIFTGLEDNTSGDLMASGVVISTGNVADLPGDNTAGNQLSTDLDNAGTVEDPDLQASSVNANIDFAQSDITVFEFDFTPTVQKIALGYVFTTEETYNWAVNFDYTDLFGIYITDNSTSTTSELVFSNLRELHQQANPDVVLNDNSLFDTGGSVEMNFVTTYESQVINLDDYSGFGSGESYTIKFALADQSDSSLDSAAFFDYFGSSIRLDADEDNSSGAEKFDFNNSFDASLGIPVAAAIVDSDVRITNYDEVNTSITKVYVQISNPSGSDEISIDTSGLTNISAASDTGTYIELDWTDTTGDPNNIAELKAALLAITYTNVAGLDTDPDDRIIQIYLSDGETDSSLATTTIDMLRVIDTPTVVNLTTTDILPTLTGTFDGVNADTLTITVNGIDYDATGLQSGSPSLDAGLTVLGDSWTLDLSTATDPSLSAGNTYNITAYNDNADADETDATTAELTIAASASDVVATDDTLTVGEDDPVTNVAVDGVIDNDFIPPVIVPDPTPPDYITSPDFGALIFDYDATTASPGDTTWVDQFINGNIKKDQPSTFGSIDHTTTMPAGSAAHGITDDLVFSAASATDDGVWSSDKIDANMRESSVQFEFWLMPDSGLTNDTGYIVFEAGVADKGITLLYVPRTGDDEYILLYDDDKSSAKGYSTLTLPSSFDPTVDFHQLVFGIEYGASGSDVVTWYLNGETAADADGTVTSTITGAATEKWTKDTAGEHGLGDEAGASLGGENQTPLSTHEGFEGEIAAMRVYGHEVKKLDDMPLSDTQINTNYLHYTSTIESPGTATVTEVDGAGANVGSSTTGANGGDFVINTDGGYSYNPDGAFEFLDAGETAADNITYTVDDGSTTDTATLTITITGVNDAPDAPDSSVGVDVDSSDTSLGIVAPDYSVGNSLDPDNEDPEAGASTDPNVAEADELTMTVTQLPSEGQVTLGQRHGGYAQPEADGSRVGGIAVRRP